MASTSSLPCFRRARASVLVVVLVTVLFASLAVVAFVEKASDDLIVESREVTGRRLRQEAYSALEVTLGVLEDFRQVDSGLRSPAEGWSDPLGFAGWSPREGCTAEVEFVDESGKLSLPHAEFASMVTLFQSWGLAQSDAERMADGLLAWMKKDYVPVSAQMTDYENAALPYAAPLRSLRSYNELAAIDGVRELLFDDAGRPNELWHRFVEAYSLYDFSTTNLNGASLETLQGMGLIDRSQQQQIGDYLKGTGSRLRQGPGYFEKLSDASAMLGESGLPSNYGTQISALRINITIHEGRTAFRLSAVVAPPGGAKVVEQVAASREITESDQPSAASGSGSSQTSAAATDTSKSLNYPFTLLEIRENAEILAVPSSPPPA